MDSGTDSGFAGDAGAFGSGPFLPSDFIVQQGVGSSGTLPAGVAAVTGGVAWGWRGDSLQECGLGFVHLDGGHSHLGVPLFPYSLSSYEGLVLLGGEGPPNNLATFSAGVPQATGAYGSGRASATLVAPSLVGGAPTPVVMRTASSGPATVHRPDFAGGAVWEFQVCDAAAAGVVAVHDSALLDGGDWLIAVDHCATDDYRTTLLRVRVDGGVRPELPVTGPSGVVGAAYGQVWVAVLDGNYVGTVLELRSEDDLSSKQQVAYVEGLSPADVVVAPAVDGGSPTVYLVGQSVGEVKLGSDVLVPSGKNVTVILELTPDGSLVRSGWLDAQFSFPLRGGSLSAHERLWVTGVCVDGERCIGGTGAAYLFSIPR